MISWLDQYMTASFGSFTDHVWLTLSRRERAEATLEECAVCGGWQENAEIEAEHEHFKTIYTPTLRVLAHSKTTDAGHVRVVPDVDVPYTFEHSGFYRIAACTIDNDIELLGGDLGAIPAGSIIDTLAISLSLMKAGEIDAS